jgi:L-ascorbate metabolism protein UlaG (beta-lactamase superfamily)
MAMSPTKLTIRAYNVGFGDCFLLSFEYGARARERHVLIDFGSVEQPESAKGNWMLSIANNIAERCGGQLDALVATHRHADHINGFAGKPWQVIRELKPKLVVQPWTEKKGSQANWKGPAKPHDRDSFRAFQATLQNIHALANAISAEARNLKSRSEVKRGANENKPDPEASRNLESIRAPHKYVFYGENSGLDGILPGVKVRVLGPPTVAQTDTIARAYASKSPQYWSFCQSWFALAQGVRRIAPSGPNGAPVVKPLFPRAEQCRWTDAPVDVRWFINRIRQVRDDQVKSLVHTMDGVLNNTSVSLLFETGGKKLLFPGDAQWENWAYALDQTTDQKDANAKKNNPLLNDVDLYKVGHHGSLNATPRAVWDSFAKRSPSKNAKNRLVTVLSTHTDSRYGDKEKDTEVPRRTLVRALKKDSILRTTQELDGTDGLFIDIPIVFHT